MSRLLARAALALIIWTSVCIPAFTQNISFLPRRDYAVGEDPSSATFADFNGDGRIDVVVANDAGNGTGGPPTLSVFVGDGNGGFALSSTGNGSGTFQAPINLAVGNTSYFAGVSDFNSDGIWATPVNAIAGPNSLTKSGGCDGCYDAGAATQAVVQSGDAFVTFRFSDTASLARAGFAHAFTVTDGHSEDFAIRIQNGYAEVREFGIYRTDVFAPSGALFRIAIQGGLVTYAMNGTVFYTSSTPVQYPFVFTAILGSANSGVQDVTFIGGGSPPPPPPPPPPPGSGSATWSSMAHVSMAGNTVGKSSGCDGCYDAFVQAEQTVGSNGYAEFTVSDTDLFLLMGLTHAFVPGDGSSIDFGIRIQGGYAEVRENGGYRSDIAAHPGAVFRITIAGGTVSYSEDGFVFYSGPSSPGTSSFAALFANLDASISNVVIANAP